MIERGRAVTADDDSCVDGVVLVTVDSLRADAINERTAPTLAALRERAIAVERAVAGGNWTPFSFPSLLGGQRAFASASTLGLAEDPTLAEWLSEAGVATAGFNDANGFLTHHWGYDRGFDAFDASMTTDGGPLARWLATHPTVQGWWDLAKRPLRRLGSDHREAPRVERLATEWLAERDAPFFLWVHYMDAHTPYVPAPRHVRAVSDDRVGALRTLRAQVNTGLGREVSEGDRERLETLYRACIHQLDESIGRLLEAVGEDTCVVVAGDHGEEFQEHGHLAHYPKLYRELVEVPFLVDYPGAPARTVERPVSLNTVPPTVCEALGVDPAPTFPGRSLLDTVREDTPVPDDPAVSIAVRGETVTEQPIPRSLDDGEVLVSARTERWTYIRHVDSDHRELYDRRADPDEQHDVYAEYADRPAIERLHEATGRRERALAGEGEGGRVETSDEVEDRLAQLGYR